MRGNGYEPPVVTELGTIRELTQQAPPGKNGPVHDGSQFQSNFSCVAAPGPGSPCPGGAPTRP